MSSIPPNTTEEEIVSYFENLSHFIADQANNPELLKVFQIADIHLVEDNMDCARVFLERGGVVRRIERLQERLRRLEYRSDRNDSWCCGPNYEARINRVMKQIQNLREDELRLTEKASVRAPKGVVSAFVTFERMEGAENIVQLFRGGVSRNYVVRGNSGSGGSLFPSNRLLLPPILSGKTSRSRNPANVHDSRSLAFLPLFSSLYPSCSSGSLHGNKKISIWNPVLPSVPIRKWCKCWMTGPFLTRQSSIMTLLPQK